MGKYDKLYVKPFTRATSAWANSVVDALNELAESVGRSDVSQLTVDIVPVEDGKLTVGKPDARFLAIYGYYGYFDADLFVQGKKVLKDEDPVNINDIFQPAQDKLVEAVYGGTLQTLENIFSPVSNSLSLEADENTNGAKLELQVDGRPVVNVAYYVDRFSDIYVDVSNDRVNWITRYSDTVSDWGIITFQDNAFKWVRVRVPTTGIKVYLEISASR